MIKRYIGKFNAVSLSHKLMKERLKPGQIAVDATCGNGHDTAFLASTVSDTGFVYAFDIQKAAADAAKARMKRLGMTHVTVIKDGHENAGKYLDSAVDGAVFNLGYLPGSEKTIKTKPRTTKNGIAAVLGRLNPNGFICITAYVVHPGGRREYRAVKRMMRQKVMRRCQITIFDEKQQKNPSPKVLFVQNVCSKTS